MSRRFRRDHRDLSNAERALIEEIKDAAERLEALFDRAPSGRYRALALTELEVAVMWIVKEISA
jgi:hypothetical protein